jgi:hypothetical protein
MRFQANGKFTQGVADVDPVASPGTIIEDHVLNLPRRPMGTREVFLQLIGTGTETLTIDLYFLIDETDLGQNKSRFVNASHKWIHVASGTVITNGVTQKITVNLVEGGVLYARRTADTITASQTRVLLAAWRDE